MLTNTFMHQLRAQGLVSGQKAITNREVMGNLRGPATPKNFVQDFKSL